ncbi:MAG: alpha/beta hydrolase [Chloroflexi bacterium]|nr:alpha/beta hydrolase [Chloroflexota bacterium]
MDAAAVVAGDVRLGYTVSGHGEPVVLIHAGALADWFRPLLEQPILTNRYQLIVYHRANYGTSEHGCARFSVPEQAEQCRQLLSHLRITRAHLVGHSAGAAIALQLAHDAPRLVQSLTVMDPALSPGAATRAGAPPLLRTLIEQHAAGDTAGAVDGFMRSVCGERWQSVVVRMLPPDALSQALTDADGLFRQEIPALLAWRFSEEQARRVICPTLVVAGAESPPVFAQRQHLLLEWLPRADAFTLPGAGHLLHLEQPERFAAALASFLARHRMPVMQGSRRA